MVGKGIAEKLNNPEDWHTWTGILGPNLNGMWPKDSDGTDVNSTSMNSACTVFATGDDFGFVKLFSFPSKVPQVEFVNGTTFNNELFSGSFQKICRALSTCHFSEIQLR